VARIHSHLVAVGLLIGLTTPLTTPGFGQSSQKIGVLTCQTSVRFGLIIASRQRLRCQFNSDHGGSHENYIGHVVHVGRDLSFSAEGLMAFEVFAPTNDLPRGALAGLYRTTTSGNVALGLGAGAKALVHGSHRSIALEPLSVVGVNLALGVAGLRLRSVR
jgi:Protein of unknown function (DUF992)